MLEYVTQLGQEEQRISISTGWLYKQIQKYAVWSTSHAKQSNQIPTSPPLLAEWPASPGVPRATQCLVQVYQCPLSLFLVSDGRCSPRHLRVSFHIMVTSLLYAVAGWLGGGSGFGGGGGGVITSCQRLSWRSSWSCNIVHPTSNTLLMLRCGRCNI